MSSPQKTLLIIDGHALLHRAWHALPPLNSPDGRVVHGAYGFTTILLNALRQFSPAYATVTFDLKGPTFRHLAYEAYKATREKKPDELYGQVEYLRNILQAMEIPVYDKEGFEADDVIGTLAEQAKSHDGVETIIVTGDHDTLQLVDERTKVFTMRKGMTDTVIYDIPAVRERYGFEPIQLIDYKALRGDPSDNIPGVKGIGEKTATDLITTFKTIPDLYASLDANDEKATALKASVREKLLEHRADAMQAYDLCRIRRDVPVTLDLEACKYRPPVRSRMEAIFTEYGFMKLLSKLPSQDGMEIETSSTAVLSPKSPTVIASAAKQSNNTIVAITSLAALRGTIAVLKKEKSFAFHIVPATEDPVGITPAFFGLSSATHSYIITGEVALEGNKDIASLFDTDARKVCHDFKNTIKALLASNIPVKGPYFDLMIASYVLHTGERRHSLDSLLTYRAGLQIEEGLEPRAILERALPHLLPLAEEMEKEVRDQGFEKLCDDIELPLADVLARMERTGITLDVKFMKALAVEVGTEIGALTEKIHDLAGGPFNINSPTQLKKVLFEDLGVSAEGLKKTAKGKTLSTAATELEKLRDAHPIVALVLEYRELTKLQSTYIEALPPLVHPRTKRIHAEFNQTVTATGRLSSANPNLQNIPSPETPYGKKVRDGFIPEKGFTLFAADYSQFELRIVAHIANEQVMIDAFNAGEDIHWRTAVMMFGEEEATAKRRIAKVINFGILYGMGPLRLAESAGITFNDARAYIARYFEAHPGIASYVERTKKLMNETGCVETLFGRKRCFPNVKFLDKREKAEAERQAVNMPIQGTQADMIKMAMLQVDALISSKYPQDVHMLIQVHDELVFEVRDEALERFIPEAKSIMENVYKLKVPVIANCSTGPRWGTMQKR